jgi:hypothetical protein
MVSFIALLAISGHTVSVADFGARPGSKDDTTDSVTKAIQAAKSGDTVVFPKGEYHFYRDKGHQRELYLSNTDVANPRHISILIENRKNLRLEGNGSRLVFHDRVMPFAILGSRNITVHGFTVDWDRPLMSQGVVRAFDSTGLSLEIDPRRYPYQIENNQLVFTDTTWKRSPWGWMEFDPASRGVAAGTGDSGFIDGNLSRAPVSEIRPGLLRFEIKSGRGPKVGNILIIRHGTRDHAGAFIEGSADVTLDSVAFRHTSGLGVLAQYTENLTLRKVDIAPDPKSDRLFAGHDDAFHLSNCKGKILVDGCAFDGLMDDPINVHGTCIQTTERISDTTVRAQFMHGQSVGLRFGDPGDEVSFIDRGPMNSRGTRLIKSVRHVSPDFVDVEFTTPLPADFVMGDVLENLTWTPSMTVRNSVFGTVRARGILISTPKKVVVENNTFRSSGAAIFIAGDSNGWYESGAVKDVTIRHNKFIDCNSSSYQFCDAVISIHPEVPRPGKIPFHCNIRITDNTFTTFDPAVLWAISVDGLSFLNNTIIASSTYKSYLGRKEGLTFLNCENVSVSGNKLDPKFAGRDTLVKGGKPETVSISGWK